MPTDRLFVQPWVYQWGLAFEYSIATYWTGDARASLDACDQLLVLPSLPDTYGEQTRTNQAFAARLCDQSETRPATPPGRTEMAAEVQSQAWWPPTLT